MNLYILFFWMIVGGIIYIVIQRRHINALKKELERQEKERIDEENMRIAFGQESFPEKMKEVKDERKERIVQELKVRGEVHTEHVSELFEVTQTTAVQYLKELEHEGRVKPNVKGRRLQYQLR